MAVNAPMRGSNGVKTGPMPQGGNLSIKVGGILPEPPNTLGIVGKIRWKQLGEIIVGRKIWSRDWVPALEQVCKSYEELAIIDTNLQTEGTAMLVPSTNGRTLKVNPLLEHRLKIKAFIHSQLSAFGLTPLSSKGLFYQDPTMQETKGVASRNSLSESELF